MSSAKNLTSLKSVSVSGQQRVALTMIEVMMSLVVFAILLTAVASNWFTLREVQRLTQQETKIHELAQTLSERIIGANWDWIGRDRPDENKIIEVEDETVVPQTDPPTMKFVEVTERYWRRYAWSWHRREKPIYGSKTVRLPPLTDHDWTEDDYTRFKKDSDGPLTTLDYNKFNPDIAIDKQINPHNLVDLGILAQETGIPNLQVYVEYYHASMLDELFTKDLDSKTLPFWKDAVDGNIDEPFAFAESPFPGDQPELQMNPSDSAVALQAMVVRIIVTWGETPKAHRHQLVFARRK